MKIKSTMKNEHYYLSWIVIMLIALCFGSCKDDKEEDNSKGYDPNLPVKISKFLPEAGGRGQRLIIYGENFGNDPSIVKVTIGGKQATVIGVENENLFCLVPGKAYEGSVEIHVGEGESLSKVTADKKFEYQRKMLVSTLFGYKNDRDDQNWVQGKFYNTDGTPLAAGFKQDSYNKFDPVEKHILWVGFQSAAQLYRVDMRDSTFTRHSDGWENLRCMDFSPDGKYLFVAEERDDRNGRAVRFMVRGDDFKAKTVFTKYRKCTTVAVHPRNKELYYNSSEQSQFYQVDFETMDKFYNNNALVPGTGKELFKVQDTDWVYRIHIHPSGEYAYIIVLNKGCIMRADYDESEKRFKQPYLVCGEPGEMSWVDGIGVSARLNRPWQGVFVKNTEYEAAGEKDIYDLYFTEKDSHSVRILTPDGVVSTFAGRGSPNLNQRADGFVEGEVRQEARFNAPTGIEYNEDEKAFYVSDTGNRRLRKIALEELDD